MPTVSELTIVVNADTSQVDSSLKHVHDQASGLGSSLSSGIGAGIGFGVVTKGLELIGSAFIAAKGSIVDLNSSLEQSRIAFTTMLGGAQQAEDFLQQLQTFAANTPFEFPDLVTASKRMLAFGFESKQVVPLLTAVGDAVAAVGGGAETIDGVTTALGQMQAKGKVSAEEMGQLAERGIPAWDMLAKKLGTDIPTAMDMVSKGAVKAGTFIEAFQEGVSTRFGGMMEKQSLTFAGAMSTISDSLQMAIARGFKPFFDLLSAGAVALSKFVQSDTFNRWADGLAATISSTASQLREFGAVVLPIISDAWTTVQQVFERDWSPDASINPLVNLLGMIATVLRDVVFPAVEAVTGFIVEQFGIVVDWFNDNLPLIRRVVDQILTGIRILWEQHGEAIMTIVKAAWTIISTVFTTSLKNLLDWVTIGMQLVTGDWEGAWQTFQGIVERTWEALKTITGAALVIIGTLIDEQTGGMLTTITTWMTEVGTAVTNGWNAVKETTTTAWTGATGIVSTVADGWDAVTLGTGNAFNAPAGIVVLTTKGWAAVVSETAKTLTEGAGSLVGVVTDAFGQLITSIGGLARAGSALLKAAIDVGAGIVTSIRDGIANTIDGFWSWLRTNFVDKIPSFVKELLGIHSPSSVMYDIGVNMVEGLRRGMASRLPSIDDLVAQTIAKFGGAGGDATGWIRAAMALTGVGDSWLSGLSWIAQHESSGNPRAVNPESVNGEHASGLFQTLPSTFRAYALPGMSDIWNPVHNAAAAIRYIQSAYVSHGRGLDWIIAHWAERGGYAAGGWAGLHGPELAWLGERGPEYVVPNGALRGGGGTQHLVIDVTIGGRVAEQIVVEGLDLAARRGRVPGLRVASAT